MWEKIKNLMQKSGGKFIIIEDNKPAYVILPIEEYEELLDSSQIEKANRELIELKSTEAVEPIMEESETRPAPRENEIKVEDLPF